MVPIDTTIAFHVTSLDVIHSFWAYQLGVKADANPSEDNVAYTTTEAARIVHRPLFGAVRPVARGHVQLRAGPHQGAVLRLGPADRTPDARPTPSSCPPFSYTYVPDANGADGGYYPDNVDPYSNVETVRRHESEHTEQIGRTTEGMALDMRPSSRSRTLRRRRRLPVAPAPASPRWLGPNLGRALVGAVGRLRLRPLGRQHHRQRLHQRPGQRPERRRHRPRPVDRRGGLAGRRRGCSTTRWPRSSAASRCPPRRPRAGPATSARRSTTRSIGLQYTVVVLLFFFTGGLMAMAHPDRAAQPDEPRLRARHLHRPGQ